MEPKNIFQNIPWESGLTLLGAIEASAAIPSGAALSFSSDRSGHAIGLVIDEVPPGDTAASEWLFGSMRNPLKSVLGPTRAFVCTPMNASLDTDNLPTAWRKLKHFKRE
jgi:hypothetical protein